MMATEAQVVKDIAETLPYLNAALGGLEYLKDPPVVTFKVHGKDHHCPP